MADEDAEVNLARHNLTDHTNLVEPDVTPAKLDSTKLISHQISFTAEFVLFECLDLPVVVHIAVETVSREFNNRYS